MHPLAKCMKQHQTEQKQQIEAGYLDHGKKMVRKSSVQNRSQVSTNEKLK